jgi:hypothetical protein
MTGAALGSIIPTIISHHIANIKAAWCGLQRHPISIPEFPALYIAVISHALKPIPAPASV